MFGSEENQKVKPTVSQKDEGRFWKRVEDGDDFGESTPDEILCCASQVR